MRNSFLTIFFTAFVFAFPTIARAQREKLPDEDLEFVQRTWPRARKLFTGLRYLVERVGHGAPAKSGDLVNVLYQGYLLTEYEKEDGKPIPFDKVLDPRHPFQVRVGRGQVIEGWDEILGIMHPGSKYLVVIPSELAYGSRGQPPAIPRDATLVFTIELLSVAPE